MGKKTVAFTTILLCLGIVIVGENMDLVNETLNEGSNLWEKYKGPISLTLAFGLIALITVSINKE